MTLGLPPPFRRLASRVRPLGNPAKKHLRAVERYGDLLVARLEASGTLPHVHLDRCAPGLSEDFARVVAAGRDVAEQLVLLGVFYAVQLLHQNARALEQLAFALASQSDRRRAYAAFLERADEEFAALISTYVRNVLALVLPPEPPPFVLLTVGTRMHQDDIDIAVLDDGGRRRGEIDRAIAQLSNQCLRFASPLDHYLAHEVRGAGFSVSIGELQDALGGGRAGFVMVTELLRAAALAGDEALQRRLQDDVLAEYFHRPGHDNSRHELLLRGLLGETRSLILRPPAADRINPKDDGLRLILGLTTAFRTIERVEATQPREALAELTAAQPRLRPPLSRVEASRVFLETFRHAAQLLVTQEDDISVEGAAAAADLERIAHALGYRSWGPVKASEHLLVHYYEAVEAAKTAAVALMDEVALHLTSISRFSRWARSAPPDALATELAETLVANTRVFRGVRFYDDLLDALAARDGRLLPAFMESHRTLPPRRRAELARLYAEWGSDAPYAFLTLVTLVAAARGGGDPARELAAAYLDRLPTDPEAVRALSRVFRFYPALTNRFLLTLGNVGLERLAAATDLPIGSPQVAAARDRFRALIRAHQESSRYVKRVLTRVTVRYPETVGAIADDATLRTLALGRLADSERHPNCDEQKGLLGDFYDIEFLRIAMANLRGESSAHTRAAFAELTTTYLERLFDFCFRELDRESPGRAPPRDRVGILLSGGNARWRPYDEDYDFLALSDSGAPDARSFIERLIARMNRQIARRGVIAQYRLGHHLGRFVATFDELIELLERGDDELFVDRCQLLGARLVVGGRWIEEQLVRRVMQPLVFARAAEFAARIRQEIADHRQAFRQPPPGLLHLKESPGGLREIDLCLAAARARAGVWPFPDPGPFAELARCEPQRSELYEGLGETSEFLVAVRSAYRVAVAASDEIERENLRIPARILGLGDDRGAAEQLFSDIERRLAAGARLVDQFLAETRAPTGP